MLPTIVGSLGRRALAFSRVPRDPCPVIMMIACARFLHAAISRVHGRAFLELDSYRLTGRAAFASTYSAISTAAARVASLAPRKCMPP